MSIPREVVELVTVELGVRREPPTVGGSDGPRIPVFSSAELEELLFDGGDCGLVGDVA